jgi:P27 family predicted phage terminase small subunit
MAKRGPKTRTTRTARPKPAAADGWEPPVYLTGESEAAWRHVVGQLRAAGNLDRTDPTLVECYAVNVALLRRAREAVDSDGVTLLNGAGVPAPHPAVAVMNSATMRIKAIINDLGLCPASSKHAAAVGGGEAEQGDKWAGMLGVAG